MALEPVNRAAQHVCFILVNFPQLLHMASYGAMICFHLIAKQLVNYDMLVRLTGSKVQRSSMLKHPQHG
jgi:hypothetical protein